MDTNAVKQATKNLAAAERRLNKAKANGEVIVAKAVAKAEKRVEARIQSAVEAYDAAKLAMKTAVGSSN